MTRTTAGLLLSLCLCSPLLARDGTIKTSNGMTYHGNIREDGDRYVVTIDNVETPIEKGQVTSLDYTGTIEEQFNDKMKALDAKDAKGRVAVGRFAFEHGRNDLAVQALSEALKIDPNNADAMDMVKTVDAQQQLNRSKAATATPVSAAPAEPITPTSQPAHTLLTAADINAIRQTELRSDEQVPFTLTPEAKKRFLAESNTSPSAFGQMSQSDQLNMLLSKGSDAVRAGTKITRDPLALVDFKRLVAPAVLRNCATSSCHGGMNAGNLVLFTGTDDTTMYTNFYILEQYSETVKGTSGGVFGGAGQRKLIDRGNGIHSLLVNFGLPAGAGEVSHPVVPNANAPTLFTHRGGPLYDQIVGWMDHDLNLIEPNYGIKYTIPHGNKPATQPMK